MSAFFGVTFLASEYRTTDGGRMDSIGIDENHCPVIFEYKRSMKENVINQGLFYLNWLLDHKDSFKVLVINNLGLTFADKIDWTMPRVICIASDFTKYDESAIKQMNRNISLIRYKKFGKDLLMFEQINENIASVIHEENAVNKPKSTDKTFEEQIAGDGAARCFDQAFLHLGDGLQRGLDDAIGALGLREALADERGKPLQTRLCICNVCVRDDQLAHSVGHFKGQELGVDPQRLLLLRNLH